MDPATLVFGRELAFERDGQIRVGPWVGPLSAAEERLERLENEKKRLGTTSATLEAELLQSREEVLMAELNQAAAAGSIHIDAIAQDLRQVRLKMTTLGIKPLSSGKLRRDIVDGLFQRTLK